MATNNINQIIEQPIHETTIYAEPVFHIGNFQITNSLLNSWLAVLVIIILCVALRLKLKQIPGKIQHIFEILLEGALSLCDQVTNDRRITLKIFPLVTSLFIFILVNNWLGLLPIVGSIGFVENSIFIPIFRAGTADINTTLALSIATVIGSNIFGIVAMGAWKIFNKYVNIKALGGIITKFRRDKNVIIVAPITFFVGILELIGEMAKVASLSFRLFGNVFAGEVLLASMGAIFLYILPTPFLFLEVFIGLIQALIFSLLATVYFTIASQDHEEHGEEEGYEKELAHV
ncbi:MAG: ATP synthase subunit a [Candidatus Nomurabacteria bacterium GW2011_GWA1_37_20]|uniref:ATP synthase subunit a n=2 Tax=Parcubacteria group TaxID=1794811 RepID=A0A0G0IA48_9BACT|nr:MAG: ATP synthase subunit a [Parcubacteria group bacterium GW2011_GWC1_36_9]KKQ27185.1 MAG: ATP synthase subunit a [Parcubacteria group bacterium GW2011_GWB1_37_13]KKQ33716.1 MAG: ATP synthase subunit a [Candidatus Nomurabacteria bacterium GW2011_GWA1_37_20]KKQ47870.1 MAG: ATP synthase subunit a [Candidatus Yanofskybacteria bacterium GW2011_GWC2_37_9]